MYFVDNTKLFTLSPGFQLAEEVKWLRVCEAYWIFIVAVFSYYQNAYSSIVKKKKKKKTYLQFVKIARIKKIINLKV